MTYISQARIPSDWNGKGFCLGIPELVVEIVSPSQTFGEMTQKATDYLLARVNLWIVDTKAQSVTVFECDRLSQTIWLDEISTLLLPDFVLKVADLFGITR